MQLSDAKTFVVRHSKYISSNMKLPAHINSAAGHMRPSFIAFS